MLFIGCSHLPVYYEVVLGFLVSYSSNKVCFSRCARTNHTTALLVQWHKPAVFVADFVLQSFLKAKLL